MSHISTKVPNGLKTALRPYYNRIKRASKRIKADHASLITIRSIDNFQVAYRKGTADESVIAHSFDQDIFLSQVPEYRPQTDHVIIDIGAHIGTFSLLAASKAPDGKVFAIEACEDSFNLLRINAALNRAANISTHHVAIANKKGTCRLHYDRGNWGHSTVSELSASGENVACCTLAQFVEQNNITKCHFLKLNCEGAEFPILLSSDAACLHRFQTLLVLYHCDLWPHNTEQDLLLHLQSHGFSTAVRNRSRDRGWIIATKNRCS